MEVWEKSGDSQNLTSGAATSKDRPASHSGTEPTHLSRFHRALRRYPSSCLFEPTVVFVAQVILSDLLFADAIPSPFEIRKDAKGQ